MLAADSHLAVKGQLQLKHKMKDSLTLAQSGRCHSLIEVLISSETLSVN